MFRTCLLVAISLATCAVSHAQVGYNPYANYERWQNSPRPFYYQRPAYYQRIYSPPVVRYPYNAYRSGYYYDGSVDLRSRSRTAALQETSQHLQNLNRSLQILSLQQQMDSHANRMEAIRQRIDED